VEFFSEELFVDEESEWSSSESSSSSMSSILSDDWWMDSYLCSSTDGNEIECDKQVEEKQNTDKGRDKEISEMTLNYGCA
jgi:hypothetical protein